ncbi:hypothetical protein T4B_4270 [Trichinella pseudospiralis]|uniref:Uncharacterized protein n=1 Tax=Trichinella pseudospiralis TaxID=6337 RepID=A0A0V1IEF8_TRIPS|nr:hypothetical protein T4B_4270 [Trichinella pseudospiralis]
MQVKNIAACVRHVSQIENNIVLWYETSTPDSGGDRGRFLRCAKSFFPFILIPQALFEPSQCGGKLSFIASFETSRSSFCFYQMQK